MKVKQALLKYVSPLSARELRLAAASCGSSAGLAPGDEVTVLFILCFDKDAAVSAEALKSMEAYPTERLLSALEERLDPLVIKKVLELRGSDEAVQIMAALNPGIDDDTLKRLAETGPEEIPAALSEEPGILARKPFLKDALKRAPAPDSARQAPSEEAPPGASPEAAPKDLTDEKRAHADEQNLFKLISNMGMGQKLKLALSGNKSARELLVKDSNKIISLSVLKNPRITEDEVLRIAASKSSADDLLRLIGRNKEWLKNYTIRVGVVSNPKTPLTISLKLLDYVYEKDLLKIAKSKSIPSVLATAARRKLESKEKKG